MRREIDDCVEVPVETRQGHRMAVRVERRGRRAESLVLATFNIDSESLGILPFEYAEISTRIDFSRQSHWTFVIHFDADGHFNTGPGRWIVNPATK